MATIYGDIVGINWLREDPSGSGYALCLVSFTMPAYTASTDNGQLGGNASAGTLHGAASDTLQTILASSRRDGKTVTLSAISTAVAVLASPGKQSSTSFYLSTPAVSSSNLTFNLANSSGTEIDAASGVSDQPMEILISCSIA